MPFAPETPLTVGVHPAVGIPLVLAVTAPFDPMWGAMRPVPDKSRMLTSKLSGEVSLSPVSAGEFDELATLRLAAMRDSLEQLGRFDPERSRLRFRSGFKPEFTWHILQRGIRVGFITLTRNAEHLSLEHLYVHPNFQGHGVGSSVIRAVFQEAESQMLPVKVGALRGSASNRFYQRHGFVQVGEGDWDIYYLRVAA